MKLQRDDRFCMQGSWLIDLYFPKLLLSTLTKVPKEGVLLTLTEREALRH